MLGNAKQADLKLGAAVYQEMQVLRFLGDTAAAGRHEAILQFITGRGNVSRAEIEAYLRGGIAAVVDAEFNKTTFSLRNAQTNPVRSHNAVLARNPKTGEYTISYWGAYTSNGTGEITESTLDTLLAAMGRNKTEFDQTGIAQVRAEAANIPAVFLAGTGKDPRPDLAAIITAFYLNPTNQTAYGAVRDVNVYYDFAGGTSNNPATRAMYENIGAAYINTLTALSPELKQRVINDSRGRTSTALSREVRNRLQL
jgi:hypothetical protein